MRFDNWFNSIYPEGSIKPEVMRQAFREIALKAWDAKAANTKSIGYESEFWLLFSSEKDKRLIGEMLEDKDMSPIGLVKLAIRHLQYAHAMAKEGYTEIHYAKPTGEIYIKPSKLPPDFKG